MSDKTKTQYANPNSPKNKLFRSLKERWNREDYPGGTPRFQLMLLARDALIFILLPVVWFFLFKSCISPRDARKHAPQRVIKDSSQLNVNNSQIITFGKHVGAGGNPSIVRRAPGTLVKVRLQNVVETYSTTPVHAQIIDNGLGINLRGGVLIGDATPDTNFERINITFKYAKDPRKEGYAATISARALSMDGTFGLEAKKKEGFTARSVLSSASSTSREAKGGGDTTDFKQVLFRALTAGLVQEFSSDSQVEQNRASVLTLQPATEFLAELTDYFPGSSK